MNKRIGRVLIAAGAAAMIYGVNLIAGMGWAVLVGGFAVYVAGFHLSTHTRADDAQERFEEAHARVSESIKEARQSAPQDNARKARTLKGWMN